MVSAVIRTPKLSDGEIITLAVELLKIVPDGKVSINYPLDHSASIDAEFKPSKGQLSDSRRTIQSMELRFSGNIHEIVCFQRGVVDPETWSQHPNRNGFYKRQPHAFFDELGFLQEERSYGSQQPRDHPSKETALSIINLLNLKAVESSYVGEQEPDKITDLVVGQIHELKNLHLEMTKGLAEAQLRGNRDIADQSKQLESEYQKRVQALSLKEDELEDRRQELNDREPQHERRRLREILTQQLRESLQAPLKQGHKAENLAYFLYLATAFCFMVPSVLLAIQPTLGDADFWAHTLKSVALGIGAAAFAWAGLSGLRSSAIALREHEKTVERYGHDMDRASWVVETILQMGNNEKTNIPDQWLSSVCRDMFSLPEQKHTENKSLEAWAALFDATARAKIGPNGPEFEIDRKGAKKLAD